jgi:outer membrane lipoprotein-sorting protein
MSFTGMVLGGDIPDVQFTFKAPPGVTVVQM